MGIVNVTPDSFSDGGRCVDEAIDHGLLLFSEGADILDIGGESSRPGAFPVSVEEELARVLPVIEALVRENIPVSVDTVKPEVMKEAIRCGACMINDIRALEGIDPGFIARSEVGVCLMHMQGEPRTMQDAPLYRDVVEEVSEYLGERIDSAVSAGIAKHRIVIDPGFGFGKTLEQNLELLRNLEKLKLHGVPILAGLSRKTMLGAITGRAVNRRDAASLAASLLALERGADIVRVHEVTGMRDAIMILDQIRGKKT